MQTHRLAISQTRPGVQAQWSGTCCCGVTFSTARHRLDVEASHQAHLLAVAEEMEREGNDVDGMGKDAPTTA